MDEKQEVQNLIDSLEKLLAMLKAMSEEEQIALIRLLHFMQSNGLNTQI